MRRTSAARNSTPAAAPVIASATVPYCVMRMCSCTGCDDNAVPPGVCRVALTSTGPLATAVASGPVLVNATLHTPGGTALSSQPVQLHIRITQYGTVALAITGAAAGVLFLAALVRLTRRALATRRKEPARPA